MGTAESHPSAQAVTAVSALEDQVRRSLFDHVRSSAGAVTREDAAETVGISRKLAAFHLDKLVEAGLLVARTSATQHRGVGRRPKEYLLSEGEVRVSIPLRQPDLLATILVDAVETGTEAEQTTAAAIRVAAERGSRDGRDERARRRRGRPRHDSTLDVAADVLSQHGYEPVRTSGPCLRLRNCPFHPLASRAPGLVCGINQAYIAGMTDGLGAHDLTAVLAPREGQCCVEVRRADASEDRG